MARPICGERSRDAACTAGLMPATSSAPPSEQTPRKRKLGASAAAAETTA